MVVRTSNVDGSACLALATASDRFAGAAITAVAPVIAPLRLAHHAPPPRAAAAELARRARRYAEQKRVTRARIPSTVAGFGSTAAAWRSAAASRASA